MATNYPGAIDSLTNPSAGDALNSPSHAAQHANANDAIEAIETELGTDPAGASATVKARFEVIEADDWVTSARIAADAVGSSEIAANAVGASELADNAVDTAAVADSAITTAKVADGAVTAAKLATTGRFLFPTGAANGYGFTGGAVHLEGTSAPEGVVTANPGSTFLQTSGAATVTGMLSWRKATGTGNTGWVAEGALADTGLRDVSALIPAAHLALNPNAKITVRRVGSTVTVTYYSGASPTATGVQALTDTSTLPVGFRWTKNATGLRPTGSLVNASTAVGTTVSLYMSSTTGITSATHVSGTLLQGSISWTTDDAWPTSLPGSAV